MSIVKVVTFCMGALLVLGSARAQPAAGPAAGAPPAAGNFRGAGGVGFGAKRMQEQLGAIQDQLKVGNDDWAALSPMVEKVLVAKQNLSTGAGISWSSSNNARTVVQPSSARPETPCGEAMQAVRDAAADADASDEDLAARMAAVREAREKAREEYETAQTELLDALTPRQQAILMTLGVVE